MPPRGPKRGRQAAGTPSPPSSTKRTRSSGAATHASTAPHHTQGALAFPNVSSHAPQIAMPGYETGESSASLQAKDSVSNSALRACALSKEYKTNTAGLGKLGTYTPVFSQARDMGRAAGGNSRRGAQDMTLAGVPLNEIGLGLPINLEVGHATSRARDLERELGFQERFPPVLPPSDVPDLAPKTQTQVLLPVPPDATQEEREYIESRNNQIALDNKAKDRQRNNQAAKKSRELRIESLQRSKDMVAQATAKVHWLRLRLLSTGDREGLSIWEQLRSCGVVERITESVRKRVDAVEEERSEDKKKKDSQARVVLNRERSQIRAASNQRISKDREVAMEAAALQESEGLSTMEALSRLDTLSSKQSSRRTSVVQQGGTQPETPQATFGLSESSYMSPQESTSFDPGLAEQTWSMSMVDGNTSLPGNLPSTELFASGPTSIFPQTADNSGVQESPSVLAHRQRGQIQTHMSGIEDPFMTSVVSPQFDTRARAASGGRGSHVPNPNMTFQQIYTIPQDGQANQPFDPSIWPSVPQSMVMGPQPSSTQCQTLEQTAPGQSVYFPPASTLDMPQPSLGQPNQQQDGPSSMFDYHNYNVQNPGAQQ